MSDRVWNLPKVITHCSCSWSSRGKNTGVVCHSLLQWTTLWNSPLWRILLGWPCMAWLIASLSYASLFAMTRLWSKKGKDWRQKEKSLVENEMVRYHHRLKGHEFEQILGDSEGQGSLECCSPWGWTWLSDWTHTHRHITHEKQEWPLDILSWLCVVQ